MSNADNQEERASQRLAFVFLSGGGELAHRRTQKKQTTLSSRLLFVVGIPGFEWRSHRADTYLKDAGRSPSNESL